MTSPVFPFTAVIAPSQTGEDVLKYKGHKKVVKGVIPSAPLNEKKKLGFALVINTIIVWNYDRNNY